MFNIEIEQFISFSEMLLDIIAPLFGIFLFYIIFLLPFGWLQYNGMSDAIKEKTAKGKLAMDKNKFVRKNRKFIILLLFSTVVPLLFFIGKNELQDNCYGSSIIFLMNTASSTLFFLMIFAPMMIWSTPLPKRTVLIVELVIVLYLYAIVLFGYCGYINGKWTRDHDTAKIEIKTNDGTIFDNESYRYINRTHNKVFLLEKNSNRKIILGDEGITYIKIEPLSPTKQVK